MADSITEQKQLIQLKNLYMQKQQQNQNHLSQQMKQIQEMQNDFENQFNK